MKNSITYLVVHVSTQLSEQATNLFDDIMRQDRIPINMNVEGEPLTLSTYIEDCGMKLWDQAFNTFFRGPDSFKKSDNFVAVKGSNLVVRRVLFRCV